MGIIRTANESPKDAEISKYLGEMRVFEKKISRKYGTALASTDSYYMRREKAVKTR